MGKKIYSDPDRKGAIKQVTKGKRYYQTGCKGSGSGKSQGTSICLSPPICWLPYSVWVFVQLSSSEQEKQNASTAIKSIFLVILRKSGPQ